MANFSPLLLGADNLPRAMQSSDVMVMPGAASTAGDMTVGAELFVPGGNANVTGLVYASGFSGDGNGVTNLNASNVLGGTLPDVVMPAFTGDVTASAGVAVLTIAANAVTNAKIRQGAARSVIGVAGSATANVADITAGTDGQVLRRSGIGIGFGAVSLATAAAVTGTLPVGNGGTGQTSYTNGQLLIGNTTGNTLAKGTLTAPAAGFSITGGGGSITFALTNDLSGVEGLAANGIATRTATDTWAVRTMTGTSNRLTVTNGDGVSGNPTFDISSSYVGQNTITTLGTVGTGTWQGTAVGPAYGGVPTGTVLDFAGFTVPSGYLGCDGTAVSRSTYATLFAAITSNQIGNFTTGSPAITGLTDTSLIRVGSVIECIAFAAGTTVAAIVSGTEVTASANAGSSGNSWTLFLPYGAGNGSTTFNLPDFRRRVSMGAGGTGTSTIASRLGATGGAETHALTVAEMPAHTHAITFTATSGIAGGANFNLSTAGGATGSTGGDGAHNNVQPAIVTQKIIKT